MSKAVETVSKENDDYLFVRMNVFKCEGEQEFYAAFTKNIMSQISSSLENLMSNAREFISSLLPKISLSDPAGHYEISFGVDVRTNPIDEAILDLPQTIVVKNRFVFS